MCDLLKISKATFYRSYNAKKDKLVKQKTITELVIKIFNENRQSYGWRRIKVGLLKQYGIQASRRIIRRIMKDNLLISTYQEKNFKVSKSKGGKHEINNVLNRDFNNKEEFVFVISDLTYVRVNSSWNYVCLLTDLSNREIIGWSVGPNKTSELVYKAFLSIKTDLRKIRYFHVDQGSEFKNKTIDELLKTFEIQRSFSPPGSPYDNAVAESLFNKAKIEALGGKVFKNIKKLEQEVFSYVWWYNNKRYHSSLNYRTPIEYKSVCLNKC